MHPDRARIRRVAGEHIYGHGTAVGRAEQAEDDLLLALLAVPVVAEHGQWRTAPLQIAGRDIVEQQGGALEMPSGEALLDPRLPPQQPVEHVEHFVAADGTEAEQGTEAAGGGLRGQAAEDVATPPRPLFQIRSIKPATLTKKPSNKIQGAVAVGDDVDVVGHGARPLTWKQYRTQLYCVSSINKDYYALRTW